VILLPPVTAAIVQRIATDIDRALQGIDGLAAIEHAQQLTSKCLVDEIVGQEHRAQQPTQLRQSLVQRIAASGSAKARQHLNCTGVPAVHRSDEVHNLLPLRRNPCQVNIGVADRSQARGKVSTMRQEQVSILQTQNNRCNYREIPPALLARKSRGGRLPAFNGN
jgi:hypothetical protein